MKHEVARWACAAACALLQTTAFAQAINDRVRIEVRVLTEHDRKDLKGTTVDAVTQKKTFDISITGAGRSPETRVAKWIAFGRSLRTDAIVIIDSGEWPVDLSRGGIQKFRTKEISTSSTREHAEARGKGRKKGRSKAKTVAAQGTKYLGYGVRVRDGAAIVGEVFDPPSLRPEAK